MEVRILEEEEEGAAEEVEEVEEVGKGVAAEAEVRGGAERAAQQAQAPASPCDRRG